MAQNQILNLLIQFGLNPMDWTIRKLISNASGRTIWFQMREEPGVELRGRGKALHFKLEELEWVGT